jgi:glutathione S-transferase
MAMSKLYSFVDHDRSRKVRWMLCELNLGFEDLRLDGDSGEHKEQQFAKLSPLGFVPALEFEGSSLFESSGICAYLADRFPSAKLAPNFDSPIRGSYMSWLFCGASTVENSVMLLLDLQKKLRETEELATALKDFNSNLKRLELLMEKKQFIVGTEFTAADIVMAYPLVVAREKGLLAEHANLNRYLDRLSQRPAAVKSRFFTCRMAG